MNTINNQEQTTLTSLGNALQAARLAALLSIEEVAEKLNLSVNTLRDIEDDLDNTIANRKYAIIYLRGYLANYAKLVKLDKLSQFVEYQQLSQSEMKVTNLRAPMILPPPVKKRSAPLWLLFFILFAAGLYLLLIEQNFFMASNPLNSDRITIETATEIESPLVDKETINRELELFDSESDDLELGGESAEENQTGTTSSASGKTSVPEAALDDPLAVQEKSTAEQIITKNQLVTDTVVANKDITYITLPSKEVVAKNSEIITQSAAITESLQLTFSANCWTEIFDATGKRLAFDLYKAGALLTVKGVAPFQLKLGDPSGVKIQYKDKVLDREFIAGRSARFSIP